MEKTEISKSFFKSIKAATLTICFVLLFSLATTPLHAQLTAARDLTGTWKSTLSGTYYSMDPSDPNTRMNDITATFRMDITQQGNQIDIILSSNIISYHTDIAYSNTYGFDGVPEAGGMSTHLVGTVSSSSFSADSQGSHLTQEHLSGTFTTDVITATLTGTSETTDQNGIIVMRTSSPTSTPTQTSTSNPTTQPSRFFGNIEVAKGQANIINPNAGSETPAASGQIGSGTQILTSDNSIVSFTPPNQGGTVYLGSNSEAGWVGLTSQPAPDNGIAYSVYPSSMAKSTNWREGFTDMIISMPIEATIAVLVFGETVGTAAAVAVVVEGGVYMLHYGNAYISETVSHMIAIPQGALIGLRTEYTVNVLADGTTTVQVISGPVLFIDPITNNTMTVGTDQVLTLPAGRTSGFTAQELQNDVSTFNSDSVSQWWTQSQSSLDSLLDQPTIVVAIVITLALGIGVGATSISKSKKKRQLKR